jgi:hypothetical protein
MPIIILLFIPLIEVLDRLNNLRDDMIIKC